MARNGIQIAFVALMLLPFLVVLSHFTAATSDWSHELVRVLSQSSLQAFISASLSLVIGVGVALGLIRYAGKTRRLVEIIVLLPSLMPSLFVIVSCVNAFSFFGAFPFGFWGVVLVHTILNIGLIAVLLSRDVESFAGGIIELATIEGAGAWDILWQVLRSLKATAMRYWFVAFVFCFSSFSVPLALGLDRGETLDVLIYRTLLGRGDLGGAIYISIFQILVLALLASVLAKGDFLASSVRRNVLKISSPFFLALFVILVGIIFASNSADFVSGAKEVFGNPHLRGTFWQQSFLSALEIGLVAVISFSAFVLVLYLLPGQFLQSFLFSYAVPSSAVLGLGFYILFGDSEWSIYFAVVILAVAFSMSMLPTLFRVKILGVWQSLENQYLMARVLGGSRLSILRHILLPQARSELFFAAGLCGLWASGDFALGSIISGQPLTLALVAQSYLGGYRMHLATFYTIVSLLIGGIVFLIFERVSHVYDSKLK